MVAEAGKKARIKDLTLQVMFQDESRFGRMNDIKRCWSFTGHRPTVAKQMIREYSYIYGAFSPIDGSSDMLILPCMTSEAMNIFLKELSQRRPKQFILLICDGASNHNIKSLEVPDNIMIKHMPSYSPQLNPSENIWEEIKEKFFRNKIFSSMKAVIEKMTEAIVRYENAPEIIKSITGWKWIIDPIKAILKGN